MTCERCEERHMRFEAEWEKRVQIGDELRALLAKLGVEYDLVGSVRIEPDNVEVMTLAPNADGKAHINPVTGNAVYEVRSIKVRT